MGSISWVQQRAAAPVAMEGLQRTDLTICGHDEAAWLRLVNHAADATAFHTPAWSSAVSRTYGFPSFVLAMRGKDGGVMAGLPVMEIHDLLGRRRLVSLPFTDHCPPLVDKGVNAAEFVRGLLRWQAAGDVPALEVRAELPPATGALNRTVGTRHLVELGPDPEAAACIETGSRSASAGRVNLGSR